MGLGVGSPTGCPAFRLKLIFIFLYDRCPPFVLHTLRSFTLTGQPCLRCPCDSTYTPKSYAIHGEVTVHSCTATRVAPVNSLLTRSLSDIEFVVRRGTSATYGQPDPAHSHAGDERMRTYSWRRSFLHKRSVLSIIAALGVISQVPVVLSVLYDPMQGSLLVLCVLVRPGRTMNLEAP